MADASGPELERRCSALGFEFSLSGSVADSLTPTFDSFASPSSVDATPAGDRRAEPTALQLRRAADGRGFELAIDRETSFRTDDVGALVHQTVWEITRRAVATRSDAVVLHAAVVRLGGSLVVISGPSGSGKSTLATSLMARGAIYLTDEAAVLDADGSVVDAVRRPIHLGRESLRMLDLLDAPVVPMPGGGGYLSVPASSIVKRPDQLVIVVLDGHEGPVSVTEPRPAHVVARLVGCGFNSTSRSAEGLRSIKNASIGSALLAIGGGSIADRANAVLNITHQP